MAFDKIGVLVNFIIQKLKSKHIVFSVFSRDRFFEGSREISDLHLKKRGYVYYCETAAVRDTLLLGSVMHNDLSLIVNGKFIDSMLSIY